MPKRSSKPSQDENQAAYEAVRSLTGENADTQPADADNRDTEARRQAARLLGSLGGRKGGPARAKKLSAKRRAAIARRAAKARWSKS